MWNKGRENWIRRIKMLGLRREETEVVARIVCVYAKGGGREKSKSKAPLIIN